jgi:hypothetical protein
MNILDIVMSNIVHLFFTKNARHDTGEIKHIPTILVSIIFCAL